MKVPKLLSVLPAITILWGAGILPSSGENIIRQTLLGSGLQYDLITSDDEGSSASFLPMEEGGSSYELFSFGSAWDDNLYFLDRKIVGHYLPSTSITIQTEDWISTWLGGRQLPRTRADRPYTLAIKVRGLVSDPTAPSAAREVLYTHTGQNYQEDTYTPGGYTEYVLNSFMMGNQEPSFTPVYTGLVPMAPTKAMGLERFTLSSLPDETIPVSSILDEALLIVWPVSSARIDGMENGAQIRDNLPNLVVEYEDLYPLSFTYIHIYKGAPQLGRAGTVFASSTRWHNTIVPQNEIISIENWEDYLPTDGVYTIEVLSTTPFNNWTPERLAYVTFNVNRKVSVNGQVTTSEK